MSEGSDLERTESPSPRRLAKAREEGQVARSRELTTFLALLAGGLGFSALGTQWVLHSTASLQTSLVITRHDAFEPHALGERLTSFALDALIAVAPLLALIAAAAIVGNTVLGGVVFSSKAFSFDLTRLSPVKGFKRVWSVDGLSELVKAIVKSILLGAIAAWLLWTNRDAFAGLGAMSLNASLSALGQMMIHVFMLLTAGLALVAAADTPLQLWRHHKGLRMTRQEVRDEARESEGDPAMKARIRSLQRQAAQRRMMAEVPKADVIVVNPTHYSVAIAYNASMRAPRVVAKGSALIALRIREIAGEHRVPILEAPPLARALYKHTELGREIPFGLYEAVALVMAYVFQIKRYRTHGGAYPNAPVGLPVPAELDFTPTPDEAVDEQEAIA
jgi:flagellar biosynthesis protein FlhB